MKRILIVEDDSDIGELLVFNLSQQGYDTKLVVDGIDAVREIERTSPELILLDLMLPRMNGVELCRHLRARRYIVPVIMLTARGEENDIVAGLEAGADDYITKPFRVRELLARVRSVLRRHHRETAQLDQVTDGVVVMRLDSHEVTVKGEQVPLTLAEFKLLYRLLSNVGKVFTRDQLLDAITDGDHFIVDRNVDVHIRSIRKKIGEDAKPLTTIRGVGYKWASSLC